MQRYPQDPQYSYYSLHHNIPSSYISNVAQNLESPRRAQVRQNVNRFAPRSTSDVASPMHYDPHGFLTNSNCFHQSAFLMNRQQQPPFTCTANHTVLQPTLVSQAYFIGYPYNPPMNHQRTFDEHCSSNNNEHYLTSRFYLPAIKRNSSSTTLPSKLNEPKPQSPISPKYSLLFCREPTATISGISTTASIGSQNYDTHNNNLEHEENSISAVPETKHLRYVRRSVTTNNVDFELETSPLSNTAERQSEEEIKENWILGENDFENLGKRNIEVTKGKLVKKVSEVYKRRRDGSWIGLGITEIIENQENYNNEIHHKVNENYDKRLCDYKYRNQVLTKENNEVYDNRNLPGNLKVI